MNITPETLRSLLIYCPETGRLAWLMRSEKRFPDTGKGGAARRAKAWNTQYAGQLAMTSVAQNGYRKGQIWGKTVLAHRVAWAIHYGEWPNGLIDHMNGDKTDNRIENLRVVTHDGNAKNNCISIRNTSGHIGVHWEPVRKKWRADITSNKRTVCLGRFDKKEDAIAARRAAEPKYGFHPNHGRAA